MNVSDANKNMRREKYNYMLISIITDKQCILILFIRELGGVVARSVHHGTWYKPCLLAIKFCHNDRPFKGFLVLSFVQCGVLLLKQFLFCELFIILPDFWLLEQTVFYGFSLHVHVKFTFLQTQNETIKSDTAFYCLQS